MTAWEILRDRSASARWIAPLPLFLFGGALGLLSPLTRLGLPLLFAANAKMHPKVAREADFGSCAEGGRVYLLTGADPSLSLCLGPSLEFYTPNKAHLERLGVLALVPQDLELTRVSDRAFDLSVLGPERRANDFERLYRSSASPLEPGQTFRAGELRVKVLETSAGLFTKARFQFDRSLDSPQSCLVTWQNHRVATVARPRRWWSRSAM